LFYVTGGGIGVNYDTRQTFLVEPNVPFFNNHKQDFDWGYTVGGGIERKIGCHWSIKLEYLYYNLEDQSSSFTETAGTAALNGVGPVTNGPGGPLVVRFNGDTDGHIVRAGLNYHF
jgi:outer membrane immunogenic protein